MVYKVPDSKRSIDQNKFEFTVPGNKRVFKVMKAKYMAIADIEKLEGRTDVTLKDILAMFGDQAAQDAVRSLDREQLEALTTAWQNDSGVAVGESSAS